MTVANNIMMASEDSATVTSNCVIKKPANGYISNQHRWLSENCAANN